MSSRFSEQDTEAFYDAEDALYGSFWDSEGSLHWGWFDEQTGDDFPSACANLNRVMLEKAGIGPGARPVVTRNQTCSGSLPPRKVQGAVRSREITGYPVAS